MICSAERSDSTRIVAPAAIRGSWRLRLPARKPGLGIVKRCRCKHINGFSHYVLHPRPYPDSDSRALIRPEVVFCDGGSAQQAKNDFRTPENTEAWIVRRPRINHQFDQSEIRITKRFDVGIAEPGNLYFAHLLYEVFDDHGSRFS